MKNLLLILSFFVLACGDTPVEPAPPYELDITALRYIDNQTSSVDYRASIVDGVSPRIFLFVNDTWELSPATKLTQGNYEYGTIVYPTEKPPIPVLYAFWNDKHLAIVIGPER